ncbi:MAG: ATP-dependent helicase/deoxyribonuclease subunit B [Firmicutes bacterium ADurb.Bin193]|nr:MAG: ATP-dependent helicase/deoxyribonuclease subunit B [Firmicutes bacterium ADurb.Bin193]
MSFRIVYGRAGSGKTSLCFNIIANFLSKDTSDILYIVPEQISLQTERSVLKAFGTQTSRIDVLSFERLCGRVFSRVGPVYADYIDNTGKQMLMQRVLLNMKSKLTVLSGAAETDSFSKIAVKTVSEFKRHNITPEMLLSAADRVDGPFKLKLIDMALIYSEYVKQFTPPYSDEDDSLFVLLEKIIKHDLYRDCHVVIDSFTSFSAKQLAVVAELMRRCGSVTVSLTSDSLNPPQSIADIFYASKKTATKLFDLARENGVEVLPNIYAGECKKYSDNPELLHLEENYFRYPAKIYDAPTKNIKIFSANNYYGEVSSLAEHIIRLCREEGCRFRDIAVITKAFDTYAPIIRHVFEEYGILFYLDENYSALSRPFTSAVLSVLEAVIRNFAFDAVFTWLKSDYCDADKEDIFLLENYVIACGNTAKMWTSPDDWSFVPKGFDSDSLTKVNEIKNRVRLPLISFASKFSGRKTVKEISLAFMEFLYESGAARILNKKAEDFRARGLIDKSDSLLAVWNAVTGAIDSMVLAMGDSYISFEKYYSILKSGLSEAQIGQIPPTVDQVIVCPIDRFINKEAKYVFIIGTTNGVFPSGYTSEGLISDSERVSLSDLGIELADDTLTMQAGENYVIYSALTSALSKLFLFYPIADNDGKALYPSLVIDRIKSIFPNVSKGDNIFEKDDVTDGLEGLTPSFNKMLANREKYSSVMEWFRENYPERLDRALAALSYTNLPQKLSTKAVSLLYGETPRGSISRAELYNKCGFAYFLRYGLRAEERPTHSIEPMDAGTFMHAIIEEYSNFCDGEGWDSITKEICDQKAGEITERILCENLGEFYTCSPSFPYLLKKIKKIMSTTAWSVTDFYRRSPFVPLGYEISFKPGGSFPPIEIDAGGTKVVLTGVVDRADVWRTENGNFVSIVDYKSSSKTIDFSQILCGIQIQLPIYIKAVCEALSKKEGVKVMPAAMLYYKIDSPIVSADRNMSDEEIWEKVEESLKMQGLTLESEKIAEGITSVFAVRSRATSEQIDLVCKTAYNRLKGAFSGIISGRIDINPVRVSGQTACEWCAYKSVCAFDPSLPGNEYKNIRKIDREEFFDHAAKLDRAAEAGDN